MISELRKRRPHGAVVEWYDRQTLETMALPSVVIFELYRGAARTRQTDGRKADEIEAWIDRVRREIAILPFDANAGRIAAVLMEGRSLDVLADAMIGATARVYGLTVVTRNTRDFEHFGVRLVNPFALPRMG